MLSSSNEEKAVSERVCNLRSGRSKISCSSSSFSEAAPFKPSTNIWRERFETVDRVCLGSKHASNKINGRLLLTTKAVCELLCQLDASYISIFCFSLIQFFLKNCLVLLDTSRTPFVHPGSRIAHETMAWDGY